MNIKYKIYRETSVYIDGEETTVLKPSTLFEYEYFDSEELAYEAVVKSGYYGEFIILKVFINSFNI